MILLRITFLLTLLIPFCTGYGQNFVVTKDTKPNCETWGAEDHTNPIIGISMTFPRGSSLDTPEQMGLSSFMVGMLGQGTEAFNHIAFSEFLEDHALKLSTSLDDDKLTVEVAFPSQFLDDTLQVLHQVLAKATFPADRLEEVRKRTVESLPTLKESSGYLAMLIRYTVSCGGKRCLQDTNGTVDSLNRITRKDLLMRYHQLLTPSGLKMIIVGDASPQVKERILNSVQEALASHAAKAPPLPEVPALSLATPGKVYHYPFPNEESLIIFYSQGVAAQDPQHYPMAIASLIVGNGLKSRLFDQLREQKGLVYSIGQSLSSSSYENLMAGSTSCSGGKTTEVIQEIRNVWSKVQRDGFSEQEVAKAKQYLTGSFVTRFRSTLGIYNSLLGFQHLGFDDQFVFRRNQMVEAVTRQDVNTAAKTYFTPDRLTFIVVGKTAPQGALPVTSFDSLNRAVFK